MLSSTELIKNKVRHGFYLRRGPEYDIDAIMEELRKDPFYDLFPDDQLVVYAVEKGIKETDEQTELIVSNLKKQEQFKNFNENELYEYAYGMQNKNYMGIHNATMHSYVDHSKPQDSIWGQFSYEEILELEAEGVEVPQEFLDWAHGEQDANTTDCEVKQDGSDDPNTVENLDNSTNNDTQSSVQKKSQAFSSQAEAQSNKIDDESKNAQTLAQKVSDRQDDLMSSQKASMEETEDKMQEWKILDGKAQNGTLSDAERSRYEELSGELSSGSEDFSDELESLNQDIDELMSQMDNITVLMDVNDKISAELEDTSSRAAEFEGDKRHGYLGDKKELGRFDKTDAMAADALGTNVGKKTALNSTILNSSNVDIKHAFDDNVAIADAATEQLSEARDLVQDTNLESNASDFTARPVKASTEPEEEETTTDENDENAENSEGEETIVAMAPVEIAEESDKINTVDEGSEEVSEGEDTEETPDVMGVTDEIEASEEDETQSTTEPTDVPVDEPTTTPVNEPVTEPTATNNNEPVKLNSQTTETKSVQAVAAGDEVGNNQPVEEVPTPAPVAETTEQPVVAGVPEAEGVEGVDAPDAVQATDAVETPETPEADAQTEDPMEKLTNAYLSECITAQSQLDSAQATTDALFQQVNGIKDNRFVDNMKSKVQFKARLKEYQALANKAESGQELTSADLNKITQLERYLDTDDGEYAVSIQNKITILNDYTASVDNLKQVADSNSAFGAQAVAQGKAFAEYQMGDRTDMKRNSEFILLSKEKRYDLLYGKSGESLGRDLIDSGEALIDDSNKTIKRSNGLVAKMMSAFAKEHSEKLNANLENATADVAPLQAIIAQAIAEQQEKQQQQTAEQNQNPQEVNVLNPNDTAIPDSAEVALNAEAQETNTDNIESTDVNARISANNANTRTVRALNSQSAATDAEIIRTTASINAQLEDETPDTANEASRMPRLARNIENNANRINRIVTEANLNVPEFNEDTESLRPAYDSSVIALNSAADDKVSATPTVTPTAVPQNNEVAEETVEVTEEIVEEEPIEEEPVEEEPIVEEEEVIEDAVADEPEAQEETFVDSGELGGDINEHSTENDLEQVCMDALVAESDENAIMLKDNGAKLSMEKLAQEAAQQALNQRVEKDEAKASASASASVGSRLQGNTEKSETGRTRRFISYEDKNRRAALADKVENGKKVVMKRGKKKNS